MNRSFLTCLLVAAVLVTGCGELGKESKVPSLVKNSLVQVFNPTSNVEWEQEGHFYEGAFKKDSVSFTVLVDTTGKLVKYKQEMDAAQLPATVAQSLQTSHDGYRIDEVEKVAVGNKVYYQIELEKKFSEEKIVLSPEGDVAAHIRYWD